MKISKGLIDQRIVSSTTNYKAEGFVGTHTTLGAKADKAQTIQITFGGRCAEQIVFGDDYTTSGAQSDYNYATMLAATMIRQLGMGKSKGYYMSPANNKSLHLHDIDHTDTDIETILETEYNKAHKLLSENIPFLLAVTDELIERSNLLPEEFKEIADKYVDGGVTIMSAKDTIEQPFNNKLTEFKVKNQTVSVELSKIKKKTRV